MTADKIKPMSVVQIHNALTRYLGWDMLETLRVTGWATDGRFAIRLPEKTKAGVLARCKTPIPADVRTLPLERFERILFLRGRIGEPKIIGEDVCDEKSCVVMTTTDPRLNIIDRKIMIDARFLATVMKHHPYSTMQTTNEKNAPVLFRARGEVVALVMPMREI